MTSFLIKRIATGIFTLFVVISLTFLMMRSMPGSPFSQERKIPAHAEKKLLEKYNLHGTLTQQYFSYMKRVIRGDLGISTKYRDRTVNEILAQTLPVSLTLGATAFIIALALGIGLGSLAAIRHRSWVDQGAMIVAVFNISIPNFVIAPLAVLVLSLNLGFFPPAGWGTLSHLILPAICLALPYSAYIARLTRSSLLEVLNQDFIRTARAKGMTEKRVIGIHALKTALLPVVSYSGPLAAFMLTGSLVIEEIFAIPGIGAFFVNGVLNRDVFMVGGTVVIYSSLLISFNILVDLFYPLLDRRIKLT